jgi:UDP-N-acetylmuramoylalanine--D-glutamate ligase
MSNWSGKHVLIIGAARQGLALARFLAKEGAQITINDKQSVDTLKSAIEQLDGLKVRWVGGGHPISLLNECHLVCLSGGVPLDLPIIQEAVRREIPLSNDTQVFMEEVPCPVIGITGSAGKTTTTTLLGRMADAAMHSPKKAWVGGNIGNPLITSVNQMKTGDLAIMEISSFQLEQMTISPAIAAVLNITPNHLDRHGTMETYIAAKARILDYQKSDDIANLNRQDTGSWNLRPHVKGKLVTFGEAPSTTGEPGTRLVKDMIVYADGGTIEPLLPVSDIQLRGRHNVRNVLAACAIARAAGFSTEAIQQGIQGFGGVAHRLEFVREYRGTRWYNDSIATAPERTMAAIPSFQEPLILLAGGRDKNLPWEDFARLANQRVNHHILFGEAAEKIEAEVIKQQDSASKLKDIHLCGTLKEAVLHAAGIIKPGDVVLLSPGGTSFDAYKDFEERGEEFRKWVQQLS